MSPGNRVLAVQRVLGCGLALAVASALPAAATASGGPCGASGVYLATGPAAQCAYAYTGIPDTFNVPDQVTRITISAVGGSGGSGGPGESVADATVSVGSGDQLGVTVGGNGESGLVTGPGGAGGYNGGGVGGSASGGTGTGGGGGGGASEVFFGRQILALASGGGGGGAAAAGGGGTGTPGGGGGAGTAAGTGAAGIGSAGCASGQIGEAGMPGPGGAGADGGAGCIAGGGGGGGAVAGGGGGAGAGDGPGGAGGDGLSYTQGAVGAWTPAEQGPSITIDWTIPPTVTISAPADGQTYTLGEMVPTSFSCADSAGPGIASCVDSNHSTGPGQLRTSIAGTGLTYWVVATSKDGAVATAHVTYTVVAPAQPPATTGGAGPPRPLGRLRLRSAIRASSAAASFSFGVTGADGYRCALVRRPARRDRHRAAHPRYRACRSPIEYRQLAAGSYVFYVRAQGLRWAGIAVDAASRRFTIPPRGQRHPRR